MNHTSLLISNSVYIMFRSSIVVTRNNVMGEDVIGSGSRSRRHGGVHDDVFPLHDEEADCPSLNWNTVNHLQTQNLTLGVETMRAQSGRNSWTTATCRFYKSNGTMREEAVDGLK